MTVSLCHTVAISTCGNLPGGRVQVDELPDAAAVREVREETGLEVEVVRLTGIYGRSDGQADIVFAFECRVVGGSLVPTDEADRHEWFDVDQLPVNTTHPETGSSYPRRVAAPARTDLPNADRTIRTSLARDPCRARRPAAG